MRTKQFLLLLLFTSLIFACNHPKSNKEKGEGIKKEQTEETPGQVSVKGKVFDEETGKGIGMAIIMVKGTTIGTVSGPDGNFLIQAPAEAKKVVFHAEGYESSEADIITKTELEVKLKRKLNN